MGRKNVIFTTATLAPKGIIKGGVKGERRKLQSFQPPQPSPVGLSSAAVVNKKTGLRREKSLAGFGRTGHAAIHIQSEHSTPFARPSLTAL